MLMSMDATKGTAQRLRLDRVLVVAGLSALLISGCSAGTSHDHSSGQPAASGAPSQGTTAGAQADPADVMFAQMMIPHHEQAVLISELALTRAQDPELVALAREIVDAQQEEISQMAGWLTAWGAPRLDGDAAMSAHGGHGMAGMLSEQTIEELRSSSGASFDRQFAAAMIDHHQGAIEMAEGVVNSSNPDVARLAGEIIQAQNREIEVLEAKRDG